MGFKKWAAAFLILWAVRPLHASSGTEGASFLDIPVGAGPAALGSAYSALADDAYAPVYNPAGLGFLTSKQLAAQHLAYLESIHYEFGSFVMPVKEGHGLGGSIQYLGTGDIAGTDPTGASIGSFASHYAAYSLAYGQKIFPTVSLGVSGKIVEAKLADVSASAFAADLGALAQISKRLRLATTVNNIGSSLKFSSQKDSLPLAVHLAAAYSISAPWRFALEGIYNKTGLASARTGIEWSPLAAISIRAGYRTDTLKELSALAGLSAGLGVHLWGQELAYAWVPYGDLGDTQYISLLLKFGAEAINRRNLIQYQRVKSHRTVLVPSDTPQPEDDLYQLIQNQKSQDEAYRNTLAPLPPTDGTPSH